LTFRLDAPSSHRLCLEVSSFKYYGSEGSLQLGYPVDILGMKPVVGALEMLTNLATITHAKSAVLSSRQSQAGCVTDLGSPKSASQIDLFTQLNQSPQKKLKRASSHNSKVGPAPNELFALLGSRNAQGGSNVPSQDHITTEVPSSMLAPVAEEKLLGAPTRPETKANSQAHNFNSVQSLASPDDQVLQTGVYYQQEQSPTRPNGKKENDQESEESNLDTYHHSAKKSGSQAINVDSGIEVSSALFLDRFQESHPFKGMKRIPRNFVRISKAQQTLLDLDDAWFEPEGTDCRRNANIPTQVQKDLTTFLSRKPTAKDCQSESDDSESDSNKSECEDDAVKVEGYVHMIADNGDLKHIDSLPICREISPVGTGKQTRSPILVQSYAALSLASVCADGEDLPEDVESMSWSLSPPRSVVSKPFDSIDGVSPAVIIQSTTHDQELSDAESLPEILQTSQATRPRFSPGNVNFPSSSAADEDELEIGVAYAVGDYVEGQSEHDHNTERLDLPCTAPQSSKFVQVERTPQQANPQRNSNQSKREKAPDSGQAHRTTSHGNVDSDHIIPGTFEDTSPNPVGDTETLVDAPSTTCISENLEVNNSKINQSPARSHGQISDEVEDEGFESRISTQQSKGLGQAGADCSQSSSRITKSDSPRIVDSCPALQITMPGSTPKPSDCIASQNLLETAYSSAPTMQSLPPHHEDIIQVPTTQNLIKNPLKRKFDKPTRSVRSGATMSRTKIANLIAKEDSTHRDTREMARLNRHLFNRSFNDHISASSETQTVSTRNVLSPPAPASSSQVEHSTAIIAAWQSQTPDVDLRSGKELAIESVPQLCKESSDTQYVAASRSTSAPSKPAILDLTMSTQAHAHRATSNNFAHDSLPSSKDQFNLHVTTTRSSEDSTPFVDVTTASQTMQSSTKMANQTPVPTMKSSYFEEFQSIYPEFSSSKRRFTEALVYIEWLRSASIPLHRSLCDDFIRVYTSEYIPWAQCQRAEGKPIMTGWEFYDANIEKPHFQYGFITPGNMKEALGSLDIEHVDKVRAMFRGNKKNIRKRISALNGQNSDLSSQHTDAVSITVKGRSVLDTTPDLQAGLETSNNQSEVDSKEDSHGMGVSDIKIQGDILDQSTTSATNVAHGSAQNLKSMLTETEKGFVQLGPPRNLPLKLPKHRKTPFFETPSQLATTVQATAGEEFSIKISSSPPRGQRSGQRDKIGRLSPWPKTSSPHPISVRELSPLPRDNSPSSSVPYLVAPPFRSEMLMTSRETSAEPSPSHRNLSTPKKHAREPSPILGNTPDPNEPEPEPKLRKLNTTKSVAPPVHQHDSSPIPPLTGSRISSHRTAVLADLDGTTKVGGWLKELELPKKHEVQRVTSLDFGTFLKNNHYVPRKDRKSLASASVASTPGPMS